VKRILRQWRVWLLLAVVWGVVGAFMGWSLWRDRESVERQELERLTTQTRVIEENLTRHLITIKLSLQSIAQALPRWQASVAGHLEAQQTLVNMEAAMSSVRTFLVTDAQGVVTFSNREELIDRNVFSREYVQAPLKSLDPKRMFVSPPFKSVLNNYLINLTLVLVDGQGQFSGVVSAGVDPVDMEILLNSVRYSDDMQAMLVHGDGLVFISKPAQGLPQGQDLSAPGSSFTQHLRSRQGVSHVTGAIAPGLERRLVVMHTIFPSALEMDKPLIMVVNRDMDVLMAPWEHAAIMQSFAFMLLVAMSVLALSVFQRQRTQKIMIAKRLKLATEASGVGIWEFDLVTKSYQWDATMYSLFGLEPKAANPRNDEWISLLSAQDLQCMRDATRATIQHDQPFALTFQICRPDGQVRYMRNRAALYSDDNGVPRRLIGSTADVTKSKQQEADLRVAAAAFESHESMMVTNAQVEILRVNQAFTDLFGWTASDVLGSNPRMLKSGRHDIDFYVSLWTQLQQQHSWQGEIWNLRKNGDEFPCWLCITVVCDESGHVSHYVATHTDITLRKAAEDEVKRLAFFDPLTNLPNRRLLTDRLRQAVVNAKRIQGRMALIYVDLDKFKPVNDRHGHAAGDQLLQSVAHRLNTCVRESDTVARVGGDEFVVLLGRINLATDAMQVAGKIHAELRLPFNLPSGQSVQISSSAGIALYPEHGLDQTSLSHHADVAMYAAKAAGRDQYVIYEPSLDQPMPTNAVP
jgi:diguanylate cyclase (GGDEF)-like protein/PAS domain S-box-containing protein